MNINAIDRETLREAIQEGGRKKSLLLKYRWFLLFVGLPTFVAAVYYGLIASPVYVSQSTFVIKSPACSGVEPRLAGEPFFTSAIITPFVSCGR